MSAPTPDEARPLTTRILLAMGLGVLVGLIFGAEAGALGIVGKPFIQLIKVIAVPLVFLSILDATISTSLTWKSAGRLFVVIGINTSCALLIGLVLSNIVEPGTWFKRGTYELPAAIAPNVGSLDAATLISSIVPESIVAPFANNNIISIVILALLVGSVVRRHLASGSSEYELVQAERLIRTVLSVWTSVVLLLIRLVPIAVFCMTAKIVGEHGFEPFKGLALYVGVAILGMSMQISIVYPIWIRFVAGMSMRRFIELAKRPVVYAFGTNSSLATLPLTLESLDSLKVSKASSRLGACIGTNLNNDGILLYEAMAVLFVAQALGIELTFGQQLMAAGMSVIAAIGVAGVPEAGVVSLSLVLAAVGLPLEIVPLLLTVDWMVARMRSVTNVLSDMTVSIALDGLAGPAVSRKP